MSQSKKRTPKVEEVRPYVEGVAKNLIDRLYGPDGPPWGTPLSQVEDRILAWQQVLSCHCFSLALTQQAQQLANDAH